MFITRGNERSIIYTCYLSGPHRVVDGTDTKIPQNTKEAIAKIEEWYKTGVPFFTRQSIREIDEQLQRPFQPGQKIVVKGLDHSSVEFEIWTGRICASEENGFETEILRPQISYSSYDQLKDRVQHGTTSLDQAYFPLQVKHKMCLRSEATHERISPKMKDLSEVSESFKRNLQIWKGSVACQQLERILSRSATKHRIHKVIGIGCGSMASDDLPGHGNGPNDQHALILSVHDWAASKGPDKVTCYAQDPIYTEVDKAVLEENGIQVIEDPQAWLEVDDTSVVFSSYPDVAVKDIIADLARPAVRICNRVKEDDEKPHDGTAWANPNPPRVFAMIQEYHPFEFWNGGEESSHNSEIIAYVRKQ